MSQMAAPETLYTASSPRLRIPEFALVFAVIVLMLVAGVALIIWTSPNSTPATIVAPGPFDAADAIASRAQGMAESEAVAPLAAERGDGTGAEPAEQQEAGRQASQREIAEFKAQQTVELHRRIRRFMI